MKQGLPRIRNFIIWQTVIFVAWILMNGTGWLCHWDPYSFILMNLTLSLIAFYAASIILIGQNPEDMRDKDRITPTLFGQWECGWDRSVREQHKPQLEQDGTNDHVARSSETYQKAKQLLGSAENHTADIEALDQIEAQANMMADSMADGRVKQFPDKFKM